MGSAWPVAVHHSDFGVAIFVGLLLLTLQWGWNTLGKRRRRKAAIEDLREFFHDWDVAVAGAAHDEDLQFDTHEQMLRRMNRHLTSMRPDLSDRQWSDITKLIWSHEELIEERRLFLPWATNTNDPVPPRFILLPWEYREFFERAIKIKWLKPGKEKPRKKAKMS